MNIVRPSTSFLKAGKDRRLPFVKSVPVIYPFMQTDGKNDITRHSLTEKHIENEKKRTSGKKNKKISAFFAKKKPAADDEDTKVIKAGVMMVDLKIKLTFTKPQEKKN